MSRYNQTGGNTEPMPFVRKWGPTNEMGAAPPPPPPPIPQQPPQLQQQQPMMPMVKIEPGRYPPGELAGGSGDAGRYGDEDEGGRCRLIGEEGGM